MAHSSDRSRSGAAVRALAERQHGLVTREQLIDLGYSASAIQHRLARGRLFIVRCGIYAVGSPARGRLTQWMAAVLGCGSGALLSHWSALALWGVVRGATEEIHVTIPRDSRIRRPGLIVHRRPSFAEADRRKHHGIPVTSPHCALFEVAALVDSARLEMLLSEADRLGFVTPDELRQGLATRAGTPGVKAMRMLVERADFRRTDSELERRFLHLVRATTLGTPRTQVELLGYRVDFLWPELELIVETDGLRYHRTEAQQRRDRRRDRELTAAGYTVLRFTHAEVFREPARVTAELERVAARLRGGARRSA